MPVSPIPTLDEELYALDIAMSGASSVRRMPGAIEDLLTHGKNEAAEFAATLAPRAPPAGAMVLCLIDRGPLLLPDNIRDCCADCGITIQKRPDVPSHTITLCVFCCVERMKMKDTWNG